MKIKKSVKYNQMLLRSVSNIEKFCSVKPMLTGIKIAETATKTKSTIPVLNRGRVSLKI
jgi:hypothetical protein